MPTVTLSSAAQTYSMVMSQTQLSGVAAEPEAALTVPVSNFLTTVCEAAGLGRLHLIREAQLRGVRPDFAALHEGRACGWVELKAPGHSVQGELWRGREARQWKQLSELDALIVTNGEDAILYRGGEPVVEAHLPFDLQEAQDWDGGPLVEMLRHFFATRPAPIKRAAELSRRLAPMARLLRDRILVGLAPGTTREPIRTAKQAWASSIHDKVTDKQFADDLAQVVSYAMAIVALRGAGDRNQDGYLSLIEARDFLRGPNAMLAATLGPVLETRGLLEELAPEIGAIERLASAVDAAAVARAKDPRGEPWLWFYEDFLAAYDPQARQQSGVYYTPIDVVDCQVRLVEHILTDKLGKPLGFGARDVVTLDPAVGSGTYPLTVLDHAAATAETRRGPAGPAQVARNLAENLIAFEYLPGPYSVAHLRIGQRLAEMGGTLMPRQAVRVYLTDTLDDPTASVPTLGLWGDSAVLAEERGRAAKIKHDQPVTVVIGNPPYERRDRASGGGWVVHAQRNAEEGLPLFDTLLKAARDRGVIFSAQASLYNDYVYFWRWALWKAFEQDTTRPAVVSFITASSWLTGPAFVGLRELAQTLADEVWILDLGGEGRGALKEENVFAIDTPVAVVTLYRTGKKRAQQRPATVHYRRLTGTTAQKLTALQTVTPPAVDETAWTAVDRPVGEPLVPQEHGTAWTAMPRLTDLFPWQQPGAMFNRAWPIAPSEEVLERRWRQLLAATDNAERAERFVTPKTGRSIHTQVQGLPPLSTLPVDAAHRPLVRYGYRSFDRQWTFDDPRLAALERPSLWNSRSLHQVFLSTMTTSQLGEGPALTVTTAPPDKHHFSGRGGKDVIPLYRDSAAEHPNLPAGLLAILSATYGQDVSPENVAAYVYAVLAHPGYQALFAQELATPGPRVPLTADPVLFAEATQLGSRLLWLHTFTERFTAGHSVDDWPHVPQLGWSRPIQTLPASVEEVTYDPDTKTLTIGDGAISGVREEVWNYEVSGWKVVRQWIGSRTGKGVGRASQDKTAQPLDRIRPQAWEDEWNDELTELLRVLTATVGLADEQADLLQRIVDAPMIHPEALPVPTPAERAVPK
ncbi:type ISP restriction/modification enzyme [Kocuria marina]|uniref:type ISP restriction/modification enzyme n=1 Tax=Kocuria marina TaxID=223184 RepID=UPI0037F473DC